MWIFIVCILINTQNTVKLIFIEGGQHLESKFIEKVYSMLNFFKQLATMRNANIEIENHEILLHGIDKRRNRLGNGTWFRIYAMDWIAYRCVTEQQKFFEFNFSRKREDVKLRNKKHGIFARSVLEFLSTTYLQKKSCYYCYLQQCALSIMSYYVWSAMSIFCGKNYTDDEALFCT